MDAASQPYRGRIAPSPTGLLHVGHARTFWVAQERALQRQGVLVLRNEDLDPARCRPEFKTAMMEDLRWFGFEWQEGPESGGDFGPYEQSQCIDLYREAFLILQEKGHLYPCTCSRQDIRNALSAPHQGDEEPIYPGTCRPRAGSAKTDSTSQKQKQSQRQPSWRFQVPTDQVVTFVDQHFGPQSLVAGRDFGDFVIWRHDDVPSYQLAVVVDDARMGITEVVRGADLLVSTARQILLYQALGYPVPAFYHCPLVLDEHGERLAKRHDALSLKSLRESGRTPEDIRGQWGY